MQTRHTFATMMISAGEDIGWVKNMLGHFSLQMIFRYYYAWVPKKGRSYGSSFMASV
jgi:integrase